MKHNHIKLQFHNYWKQLYWLFGLGSLLWLIIRSGANPKRLAYPCQRAALVNTVGFLGASITALNSALSVFHIKRLFTVTGFTILGLTIVMSLGLNGSVSILPEKGWANPDLPSWTSVNAISNVFAVKDIPIPDCSLDGGVLPSTPPCNNPHYAFHDDGVDSLIGLMESQGVSFYKTTQEPDGIIGANDVVVIKINNQWGGNGSGDGFGRMATNTDLVKGVIWQILQHPDNFTGEIIVSENAQPISTNNWNVYPANAEDPQQSFQDVIGAFNNSGYPVYLVYWTPLNNTRINGGEINDPEYPVGEYITGDMNDAYIMLEDLDTSAVNEYSYPKFKTPEGRFVSMRYGVWDGSDYNSDQLTFINMPVLKRHVMAGATISWKNLIGFLSTDGFGTNRYGTWDIMHDYFWGYTGGQNQYYGLLGREIGIIRNPDINIIDAVWVAYQSNFQGDAIRQDVILSSTDPFAVDWYASEFILYPLTGDQNVSAARGGLFRSATRNNQNAALIKWAGGSQNYPFMDILDNYDGDIPTQEEIDQLNVFVVSANQPVSDTLSIITPNGGEVWEAGSTHQIVWTTDGSGISNVDLRYSLDQFVNDNHLISSGVENGGVFTWTTPSVDSASVRVRVLDSLNTGIYDDSDQDFTITTTPLPMTPTLTLISPNGGEVWEAGCQNDVDWSYSGTSLTYVDISYSTDDFLTETSIAESVPNSGTFTWTLPLINSSNVRVKVKDAQNDAIFDVSDEYFSIVINLFHTYLPITFIRSSSQK